MVKYSDYYLDNIIPNECFGRTGGGYISYGQGEPFLSKQLAITYVHVDNWSGTIPEKKGDLLPKTQTKLKNKEAMKVLFFGDSIAEGCNTSSFQKVLPFAADWCTMTVEGMKVKYGYEDITIVNTSVGGMTSEWGKNEAKRRVADKKPDLVIIAFGMNDGSGNVTAETFGNNVESIMSTTRKTNPDCEFILISTMLPNKEVAGFFGTQTTFLLVLLALEEQGVAVADMTTMHKDLLTYKRYYDMTGNNVNHPNDFLSRAYCQVLNKTISE